MPEGVVGSPLHVYATTEEGRKFVEIADDAFEEDMEDVRWLNALTDEMTEKLFPASG
jgi:hypothetical protein